MLVRGTRRLASGLAIALVLLTIYMVYYGPYLGENNVPYTPPGRTSSPPKTAPIEKEPLIVPPAAGPGTGLEKPPTEEKPIVNKPIVDPPARVPVDPHPGIEVPKVVDPPKVVEPTSAVDEKTATTSSAFTRKTKGATGPTKFVEDTHRELYSLTTSDGTYFDVDYSPWPAYNPNFTPHPKKNDTWITVAQFHKTAKDNQVWFTQIICEAKFVKNSLKCTHPPWTVPIPPTWTDKCEGDIAHFNFNIGPHDARVFFSPDRPYILYGSQSSYSCFGQWFQDFTLVSDWPGTHAAEFRSPTEIKRPPPFEYGKVEKNWFLFWDIKGELYIHHDIYPTRVFGKMAMDGSIPVDNNVAISAREKQCLDKLVPYAKPTYEESIHQATNSLSITMCKKADPTCQQTAENTFVFHIFHWKSFYEFHGLYEPYVHMFHQAAPFETYGVSSKPLWYRGRRLPGQWRVEGEHGWNQTEMIYTTSIAWKEHGMKYHGYLDDILLIGFGVEDAESGGLDVVAADLFKDFNVCDGETPYKVV